MSEQQSAPTTAASPNQSESDTIRPSTERQAELRAAYEANVAAGKPSYQKVRIDTLGEALRILRERD